MQQFWQSHVFTLLCAKIHVQRLPNKMQTLQMYPPLRNFHGNKMQTLQMYPPLRNFHSNKMQTLQMYPPLRNFHGKIHSQC